MPLTIAPRNQNLKIVGIKGDEKLVKRLQDLGLVVEAVVQTSGHAGKSLVVHVGASRLALNPEVASLIDVELLNV